MVLLLFFSSFLFVTFQKLLSSLPAVIGHPQSTVPNEKKLLMTIWILSHSETYQSVGERFGLAVSSVLNYFYQMIQAIVDKIGSHIQLPNAEERKEISDDFYAQSQIPNIVGAIGCSHIRIKQPPGDSTDYYNHKSFHSIILQAICDHKLRFVEIFVGRPGRMHNASVFRSSPIYRLLTDTSNTLLRPEEHIMGDNTYPNTNFMITPFVDNGHLSPQQVQFNTRLNSVRQVIGRAFGRLKGKFMKLKLLNIKTVEHGNAIIAACCILHNFVINENLADEMNYEYESDEDDISDDEDDNISEDESDIELDEFIETIDKRTAFANSM